jgi:hypothetical protein
MATFILIHGASANPGYWARVAPASGQRATR